MALKLKTLAFTGAVALASGLAFCNFHGRRTRYNLELSISILSDGQIRTGKSVTNVMFELQRGFPEGHFVSEYVGDAVTIDLGPKGKLFCILGGHKFPGLNTNSIVSVARFLNSHQTARLEEAFSISVEILPSFVRFKDLREPTSVEAVDIGKTGLGFNDETRVMDATVKLTAEPVTLEVQSILPWVAKSKQLDGSSVVHVGTNQSLSNELDTGDFQVRAN